MRIPYPEPSAHVRTYIDVGPDVVATILRVIQVGWRRVILDWDRVSSGALGEVEITETLRDEMRAALNGMEDWARELVILQGSESRSMPEVKTPDGRTDVPILVIEVFIRYGEHDPHAIIECKRLDGADVHLCREYVIEGVDRFRTGKYAENHAAGFMAGYLLRGTPDDGVKGINRYLARVRRGREAIQASSVIVDPELWQSSHTRAPSRPPITIHHVLLPNLGMTS